MLSRCWLSLTTCCFECIHLFIGTGTLPLARQPASCSHLAAMPFGKRQLCKTAYARCADIWSRLQLVNVTGGAEGGSWVVCNDAIVLVGREACCTDRFRVLVFCTGTG